MASPTWVDLLMVALTAIVLGFDAALWFSGLPTYSQRLRAHGLRWPVVRLAYVSLGAWLYWHFWG